MNVSPPRYRIAADYDCFAVWERVSGDLLRNTDPRGLDLSALLIEQLVEWAAVYDRTLNRDDPLASGFGSQLEREMFAAWGRTLAAWLSVSIGEPVQFFDDFSGADVLVGPA